MKVTMKSRSIASGMMTGTMGTTAEEGTSTYVYYLESIRILSYRNVHQQTREIVMMNLVVICTKIITSFWNISTASAPIHITDTRVK